MHETDEHRLTDDDARSSAGLDQRTGIGDLGRPTFARLMLDEVERLRAQAVIDEVTAETLRFHYRRLLEGGTGEEALPAPAAEAAAADPRSRRPNYRRERLLEQGGAPAVVASLGVVLVFAAATFVAWQTWSGLDAWERAALVGGLTAGFLAVGLILLLRSDLRLTAIATLWLTNALFTLFMSTLIYAIHHTFSYEFVAFTAVMAGTALYAASTFVLKESAFAYASVGLLLTAFNLAADHAWSFGFFGFNAANRSAALGNLLSNLVLGAALLGIGFRLRRSDCSVWAAPLLLAGALTLTAAFVFMSSELIPGRWDGFAALGMALGMIALGLSTASRLVTAAGMAAFLGATARLGGELVDGIVARAAVLVAVGSVIIAVALLLERRSRRFRH